MIYINSMKELVRANTTGYGKLLGGSINALPKKVRKASRAFSTSFAENLFGEYSAYTTNGKELKMEIPFLRKFRKQLSGECYIYYSPKEQQFYDELLTWLNNDTIAPVDNVDLLDKWLIDEIMEVPHV